MLTTPIRPITCIFTAAASSAAAASGAVTNGGFEVYLEPEAAWIVPGVFDTIEAGALTLEGWTVVEPCDIVAAWQPADGALSLDLSGGPSVGAVRQPIAVVPGHPHALRFAMSGNPETAFGEPSAKTMDVIIDGVPYAFEFDVAAEGASFADMRWRAEEIVFVPSSATAVVEFRSTMGVVHTGPVVDAITVVDLCRADIDASGTIDFEDLLAVLSAWGPCDGCGEDVDGSGGVDFADLIEVLIGWGSCGRP